MGSPFSYITVPICAALVGYGTNWVGVQMIFYPIEFLGIKVKTWPETPAGLFGWQGIVPCKVKKMSGRLVDIITTKLLSVKEAFSKIEPNELARLIQPSIAQAIEKDSPWGELWLGLSKPFLTEIVLKITVRLQAEIEQLLDLREVVTSAFFADKVLLGELFQKAGRKELDFLVDSGCYFGFFLGIIQMTLWIMLPSSWVLPVGGALVGYVTNWVAIKLIFDPVEPTPVGPFVIQGLFEKRQPEVSADFAQFLADRVLTSQRLIEEIATGKNAPRFKELVRDCLPPQVPAFVTEAAIGGFSKLSAKPMDHPVHRYIDETLDLEKTLVERLKVLSSAEFENLLHPVFQEDETTLILAGGVLGAAAGFAQLTLGLAGPAAASGSLATAIAANSGTAVGAASAAQAMMLHPVVWTGLLTRFFWVAAVGVAGAGAARAASRRFAYWIFKRRLRPSSMKVATDKLMQWQPAKRGRRRIAKLVTRILRRAV